MRRARSWHSLLLAIALWSCTNGLGSADYIKWVENPTNGLRVIHEQNGFRFDLQYQPSDYLSLRSSGATGKAPVEAKGLHHYLLRISSPTTSDFLSVHMGSAEQRQRTLYYFNYLFQDHISLHTKGGTKPCILFHREQGGRKDEFVFHLGFEEEADVSEVVLNIESEVLSALPVKVKIDKSHIPVLKYD